MSDIVYGFGDEVLISAILIFLFVIPLFVILGRYIHWRRSFGFLMFWQRADENYPDGIDPDAEPDEHLYLNPAVYHNPGYNRDRCPICLLEHTLPLETNCGHIFCGNCLNSYLSHINIYMGNVSCPMCRQQITMLFVCFTDAETQATDNSSQGREREILYGMVTDFNRRFSGNRRPLMDVLRDWPTLMRHLWNEFLSVGGLVVMFRIRIVMCFLAGCLYLISPLDILPEAVFGVLGLLDDVFVVFLLAIYVSVLYRQIVVSRAFGARS